jgi:hypothetical protein
MVQKFSVSYTPRRFMLCLQQTTNETVSIFAPKYVSEENAALILRTDPATDRNITG